MKTHLTHLALLALTLTLTTGCATMSVATDHQPDADFASLRSYAWMEDSGGVQGDIRLENNPMLDQRIRSIIDEALASKGYRMDSEGEPDFRIGYVAALEGRVSYETVDEFFRYRRRALWITEVETVEYDEGTLVIDIADGSSGDLVWRGSAQAELHSESREYREEKLREAVDRILGEFPPSR